MARVATGDTEEALDIVQDAMVTLVQRYRNRAESEWPPLFYRILQNRIRDWYRRQKVRSRWRAWFGRNDEDDPIGPEQYPDPTAQEPASELSGTQTLEQIEQALQELPLRQQQVFFLRAWEGLDVKQTAHALGISGGSVKTHYSRAVQKLRQRLGELTQ